MKSIFISCLCICSLFLGACSQLNKDSAPVEVSWFNQGFDEEKDCYVNRFVVKNVSQTPLNGDWEIFYSQLPVEIVKVISGNGNLSAVNANFYKISPVDSNAMQPNDSIVITLLTHTNVSNISKEPEGCYWKLQKDSKIYPLTLKKHVLGGKSSIDRFSASKIYDKYQALTTSPALRENDILPSVKQVELSGDSLAFPSKISLLYSKELSNEANILKIKLEQLYGVEVVEGASTYIKLDLIVNKPVVNKEQYSLNIGQNRILIEGASAHGVFNGCQTLLSMLKGKEMPCVLACQSIFDYPDLEYRGFMLDVARNFTSAKDAMKLVDLLASYKVNVLHFHFSDDEGWRLEIPELEELTEVGAHRGHTENESTCLYPGFGGHYSTDKGIGNGFYTRAEFIKFIKYAAQRHVRVIPEIEAPGHARAAIVSMKARYNKYKNKDINKAREYLLSEASDSSVYVSAQSYTDNVINVALPSAYRFMEKVITEIQLMYKEAGVELYTIHLGGDEVPEGAWMKSPACAELMKAQGMNKAHDLFEYFYTKMANFVSGSGMKFSGWQEVALHNAPKTDALLCKSVMGIYCWNTVPEWGGDVIPYQVANNQYPVVLCNVNNFYMDLAYSPQYDERGLSWAGYVDESKSFSMLPFSIYRSARVDLQDNPILLDKAAEGKPALKIPNNIKGIQAQLFSETIRDYAAVEYYIFPKIFGLVERGWNAHPIWENMRGEKEISAFNDDLTLFYAKLSEKEMPYLEKTSTNFRLPQVGLKIKDGMLYANSPIHGGTIRYTTDGTEPTSSSPMWNKPVACNASIVKARLFYLNKESVTSTLIIQ